jgi:magnesium transporter
MIYSLINGILNEDSIDNISLNDGRLFVCDIALKQLEVVAEKLGINEKILDQCINGRVTKFESYEGFDYISLKIPNINDILRHSIKIAIFFTNNILVFIGDYDSIISEIISETKSGEMKLSGLSKILYIFFDKITIEDTYFIENIEQEIGELEESLMTSKNDNYLNKIIILRKKLLKLKRYYERLLNIAENIAENDNGLIDKKTIKYFKMFNNRINRLYESVNNLRDYVTQVREAYQSQVDINQNTLMKLFTVVTTIFLPLSLIVGWYGMNFNMPEYSWGYGYPLVIVISITIVIFCIIWFKKNDWF